MANLHAQLKQCDGVLMKMEDMLLNFQNNLGNISTSIKTLQDQSFSMNLQLKNRKTTEILIGNYIDNITITPQLIKRVNDDDVNDKYLENLIDLNAKADCIAQHSTTQSVLEIKPVHEKLVARAAYKVKIFLMNQLNELKKPKVNTQIIKQTIMKSKFFYLFLKRHSKESYVEFVNSYTDTMSRIYLSKFKTYTTSLSKLESKLMINESLIIEQDSFFKSKPNKQSYLLVGERIKILEEKTNIIIPHVSEEKKESFTFEVLFKSFNMLLVETALSEYLFLSDFFEDSSLFHEVFSKVIALLKKTTDIYLESSFDILGIFLMLRIIEKFEKKNVQVLNDYFEKVKLVLFSKFKIIIESNTKIIKGYKIIDVSSFEIPKKYGALASSIHLLNKDSTLKKTIEIIMESFTKSIETLLNDVPLRETKKKLIYLINSYDIIIMMFIKNNLVDCPDAARFHNLFEESVNKYIEEELSQFVGDMVNFIKKNEYLVNANLSPEDKRKKIDTVVLEEIVNVFQKDWKSYIKRMNDDVIASYSMNKTATIILKKVLTQMLLYYGRLNAIITACYQQNPPFRTSIVPNSTIYSEMRNYLKD